MKKKRKKKENVIKGKEDFSRREIRSIKRHTRKRIRIIPLLFLLFLKRGYIGVNSKLNRQFKASHVLETISISSNYHYCYILFTAR